MKINVVITPIAENIDRHCSKCDTLAAFSIKSEYDDDVNTNKKLEDYCSICATNIQFLMEQLAEHLGL